MHRVEGVVSFSCFTVFSYRLTVIFYFILDIANVADLESSCLLKNKNISDSNQL